MGRAGRVMCRGGPALGNGMGRTAGRVTGWAGREGRCAGAFTGLGNGLVCGGSMGRTGWGRTMGCSGLGGL